ncbi:MAG: hypothetical protein ACJA1U_002571 [Bermanella sp.]|jgi:hypothetical protein
MKYKKILTMVSLAPAVLIAGMAVSTAGELQDDQLQAELQAGALNISECIIQQDVGGSNSEMQLIPIKDPCDDGGGGGGGGGPYRAPSTPSSISYAPYTNGETIWVSWGQSEGYGFSVRYQLLERRNSGSWIQVYNGYSRSYTLSNKPAGKYSYKVRATNTGYQSSYRTGSSSIINPRQDDNLYTNYSSAMLAMDQKNQQFRSSTQGAKTVLSRAKMAGQGNVRTTTDENRFYLGDGFDLVRGTLKETCLDVTNPGFVITKTPPLQPSTFDISYVNDNRQLAELLEVSQSAQIGFAGDDFSLGLSGEKERYVKSVTDESHVRFVVKVNNRREFWKLNTPTDAIYPELVSQVLSPNDNEAKADFRERCGDNFINSANLGSALYLVFTFDAKKYSYEERESAKAELGLKIGDLFSANGSSGSSSSLTEVLNRLEVKINADQVGGPIGLAASINPTNVMQKYNQFVQDTNPTNWAAVDYSTNLYQRPTVYSAFSHEQIFSKYSGNQGPLAQMKRWLDISVQHKERCDPWGEYGQNRPTQCGTSEAEISIAMDLCRETREWADCVHPFQYNTGNITTTTPGTYLLSWLSSNVQKLNEATKSQSYNHHVHRGSKQVSDSTCLASSLCFTNKFRGTGPGIGKGFSVYTAYYDNPRGNGRTYSASPKHCALTRAYLKTAKPPFGDTTADWNYSVDVIGQCPSTENFIVIP